jgi:hypothetical protein
MTGAGREGWLRAVVDGGWPASSTEGFPSGAVAGGPPAESYDLIGALGRGHDVVPTVPAQPRWAARLARLGRVAVWGLPAAAVCFALAGLWRWPTAERGPSMVSPGTWLLVTVAGLVLALVAALGVSAVLANTRGRVLSLVGLLMSLAGTVLVAPILGVVALARTAVSRTGAEIGTANGAALDARLFDNAPTRVLGLGGTALLGGGWVAVGLGVLVCRTFKRLDGSLLLAAVAVAVVASYLAWQFLLVVAAMVLLAAGLGLSWNAVRLTPEGTAPDED